VSQRKNFVGRTNHGFVCEHCGVNVLPLAGGGFRNHCPQCLWSKHVDGVPGDRESACEGLMEPVQIEADAKRVWIIVHRCVRCGLVRRNRAALNDPRQPDDFDAILAMAGAAADCSSARRGLARRRAHHHDEPVRSRSRQSHCQPPGAGIER
jgi:hypothetical protein